jgi:hypothetical protein
MTVGQKKDQKNGIDFMMIYICVNLKFFEENNIVLY